MNLTGFRLGDGRKNCKVLEPTVRPIFFPGQKKIDGDLLVILVERLYFEG